MGKTRVTIMENEVNFRDELKLDLSKYERDFEVKIDITENSFKQLQVGVSERYVAQITIPERSYKEYQQKNKEGEETTIRIPEAFDINKVKIETMEVL